jgi:Cu2+-exporting ATPase
MADSHMHGVGTVRLPVKDLYCADCAEHLERALRAEPHVIGVKVDFPANMVEVRFHEGVIDESRLRDVINAAGRCTCEPETAEQQTMHMHHQVQMAPITMGTKQDRMQYEMPSSGAGKAHEHAHQEAASHVGMDHDMSDPRMARAMETDMRNRFLVALVLTIPTVLYSPLGYDFLGIDLTTFGIGHNWIALITSTPVVWWAGWIFIGGAYRSLKHRSLNMSVLIATGVLAAYLASIVLMMAGEEDASSRRQRCW